MRTISLFDQVAEVSNRLYRRLLPLFLITGCLVCAADNLDVDFDAANKLYEQSKYSEAAAAYEKLLQTGKRSASLYFNLGNAWFKSGQIGRAIAAYRHAQELSPRDPDIRANLQFARNQTQGPTLPVNDLGQWFNKLTLDEWTVLASVAAWIWLGLLAALRWRPALRPALRAYVILLAAVVGALAVCVAIGWRERAGERTAIVVTRDLSIRLGPFEESQAAFAAHDGAEMRVLDQKSDWLQVTTGAGRIGWVRRDQVVVATAI